MKCKKLFNILLALVLCLGLFPVSASAETITDYDGYTFNLWVTRYGDKRGSSFQKFEGAYYMDINGTASGATFTFESAGNDAYHLRSRCGYDTIYLAKRSTTEDGDYYLGGTASKSNALKWTLQSDGRFHTTVNSTDYILWVYCDTLPYTKSDGFRLTTDKNKDDAVSYKNMTFTPPDPIHSHPICGAECEHNESHDSMEASVWNGLTTQYGELVAGDYYLTSDISLGQNLTIFGKVHICLNGYDLNFKNGYGLYVYGNGNLVLCDCQSGSSINSHPKKDGDYLVYDNGTITIKAKGSMTMYGIDYCTERGTDLLNSGTLQIYGGNFHQYLNNQSDGNLEIHDAEITLPPNMASWINALSNKGTATIVDCSIDATASANNTAVYNSGSGILIIDGTDISSQTIGISNCGALLVKDGTITGSIGIKNRGDYQTNEITAVCEITGGTISGTECGILNSANSSTYTTDGVTTEYLSKGFLEISGKPSIDKIILEYPEMFSFGYEGKQIIDLELGENFSLGDIVFSGDTDQIPLLNLLSEDYCMQAQDGKAILVPYDPCVAKGHEWTDATCTDPRTCSVCGETEGDSLGHSFSAGLCSSCGEDILETALNENQLTVSGNTEDQFHIIAAGYNNQNQFSGIKFFFWQNATLAEELPAWETIRLFFTDSSMNPLRKALLLQ